MFDSDTPPSPPPPWYYRCSFQKGKLYFITKIRPGERTGTQKRSYVDHPSYLYYICIMRDIGIAAAAAHIAPDMTLSHV